MGEGRARLRLPLVVGRHVRGNLVAYLALVVALSAPAVASHLTVKTSDLTKGAVTAPKIKEKAVKSAKIDSGAVGRNKLGPQVIAARAYGAVFHTGGVSQGRNLSSDNVTRPETGVYCISGLPFTPENAVVSNTAVFNAGEKDVRVYVIGTVGGDICGSNNQIRVHVYSPGTLTLSNGNFNIVIF